MGLGGSRVAVGVAREGESEALSAELIRVMEARLAASQDTVWLCEHVGGRVCVCVCVSVCLCEQKLRLVRLGRRELRRGWSSWLRERVPPLSDGVLSSEFRRLE